MLRDISTGGAFFLAIMYASLRLAYFFCDGAKLFDQNLAGAQVKLEIKRTHHQDFDCFTLGHGTPPGWG